MPERDISLSSLSSIAAPARVPLSFPVSDEIEQGLLGALLVHNAALDAVDFLRPEHFHAQVHGRIFEAIGRVVGQGKTCTAVTLKHAFADDPDLTHLGGGAYLHDLMTNVVTILNVEDYGRAILDMHQRRELMQACDATIRDAATYDPGMPAGDIITGLEASLYAVSETNGAAEMAKPFSTALTEAIGSAEAAYRKDARVIGVATGLIDLDKIIGGLRAPDLLILAGRPGMGKSAMAMGIAWHVASLNIPVAFFSLEMSSDQLATRVLASGSGVPNDLVRRGDITRGQFQAFMEASQRLASLPLYIDDSAGQTIAHIRKVARRIKRQHGLGAIVVDYLQLIRSFGKNRAENRVQEITEITAALKNIAKEFGVPVLALSQLSRAVEQREDKRPQLADLRESGSIEQDADIVVFIYREEEYAKRDEPARKATESQEQYNDRYGQWQQRRNACANRAEAIVGKNRHGATGTAYLHFSGPTTTFSNLSAVYSIAGNQ